MTEEITVCSKCGSLTHYFEPDEGETAKGKLICSDCGAFIKRQGKPKVTNVSKWAVYDDKQGGWILTFGKYNGYLIRDLANENCAYLEWILTKTDFPEKCPEFIALIEDVMDAENVVL